MSNTAKMDALVVQEDLVGTLTGMVPGTKLGDMLFRVSGGFGVGGLVRSGFATGNWAGSPEARANDEASANLAAMAFRVLGTEWLNSEINSSIEYISRERVVADDGEIDEEEAELDAVFGFNGGDDSDNSDSVFGDLDAAADQLNANREQERLEHVAQRTDAGRHQVYSQITQCAAGRGELFAPLTLTAMCILLERWFNMMAACAVNANARRKAKRGRGRFRMTRELNKVTPQLELAALKRVGVMIDGLNSQLVDIVEGAFVAEHELASPEAISEADNERAEAELEAIWREVRARTRKL